MRKNADKDKYDYSSYDIGFEARSTVTLLCGGLGKKTVIYFASNSSLVHANNKKDILILWKGPTDGLDDTAITSEAAYSTNTLK